MAAILDAAAAILAETGLEGLTLAEVAERSGTATGSLYHFFSGKDQLVSALVERLIGDIKSAIDTAFSDEVRIRSADHFARHIVSTVFDLARRHPEVSLLMGHADQWAVSAEKRVLSSVDTIIAARLCTMLANVFPHFTQRQCHLVGRMITEIVRVGLRLSVSASPGERASFRAETESALRGYLRDAGKRLHLEKG